MKKTTKHKSLLLLLLSIFYGVNSFSQESKSKLSQDPKLEQLLKEKRKINQSIASNESYKVQIFYGDSEESKRKLQEFKREFKDIDGTITYGNPNYKVMVGNYASRIEVEKAMLEFKKKYPTALIIKPNN
ncbi:SPOR domain-containing protein [Flavobacterium ardleyense]|uniref:SPOR domain-containing protein n=1 Tax=Flavobacterium ardleyense TaxID=2038737 RepID=A0ABW5ZAY8_9FLAO